MERVAHHEAALLCYDCDNLSRLDGRLLNAIQSSSILISSYLFVTSITRCIPCKMKPCQQKKVRCKQTLSEIDKYQHLTVMAVVLPGETDDKGRCRSEIISYSPNDIPEKPTNQSDGTISRLHHRVERAYVSFRAGYKECTCVLDFLEVAGLDDKGKIWYTFFNEDQLGWEAAITLESEYYLSGIGKNPGLKPRHRVLALFLQLGARTRVRFFAYSRLAKIIRPWALVKATITKEFERCLEDLMGFIPRQYAMAESPDW